MRISPGFFILIKIALFFLRYNGIETCTLWETQAGGSALS
jgi:hypothetical protein